MKIKKKCYFVMIISLMFAGICQPFALWPFMTGKFLFGTNAMLSCLWSMFAICLALAAFVGWEDK